jgi:hypothetical protein
MPARRHGRRVYGVGEWSMAGALFGAGARALQDELDTRRLADAIAAHTMHDLLTDDDVELIGAQSTGGSHVRHHLEPRAGEQPALRRRRPSAR